MVSREDKMQTTKLTKQALGLVPYFSEFWRTKKMIERTEFWDREQLDELHRGKLASLLSYAYVNIPYYNSKLMFADNLFLRREDVLNDIRNLSFGLLADSIMNAPVYKFPKLVERVATSGSTGIPLTIYYEKGKTNAREWAFIWHMRQHLGYNPWSKCVVLMDYSVPMASEGVFWYKAMMGKWLVMSTFHMSGQNLPEYMEQIRKFKPEFLQCYTSAAVTLARFMKNKGVAIPPLEGVFCSSESLFEGQRKFIEQIFGCRVHCHYGHTEKCVLAYECPISDRYHVFPQYGFTEIIGKDGNHVEEGEVGEIVATGFNNWAMPLIRYRTQDYAQFGGYGCECGRNYMNLGRIEGRSQDYIITKDGSLVSLGSVVGGIHENEWAGIEKIQFEQSKEGSVVVKIVKPDGARASTVADTVMVLLKRRLDDSFDIKIEFVDDIPLTPRGKMRLLVQNLSKKMV